MQKKEKIEKIPILKSQDHIQGEISKEKLNKYKTIEIYTKKQKTYLKQRKINLKIRTFFHEKIEKIKIFKNLEIFKIFDSGTTKISKFSNAYKKSLYVFIYTKPFQEYKMIPLEHLLIVQQPKQITDFPEIHPKVGDFFEKSYFSMAYSFIGLKQLVIGSPRSIFSNQDFVMKN